MFATEPAEKLCPSDAWGGKTPLFSHPLTGIADPVTATAIDDARAAGMDEVDRKARLLTLLAIDQAALNNEGYAIWKPESAHLLDALRTVMDGPASSSTEPLHVEIVSLRTESRRMIAEADGGDTAPDIARGYEYLPLYA